MLRTHFLQGHTTGKSAWSRFKGRTIDAGTVIECGSFLSLRCCTTIAHFWNIGFQELCHAFRFENPVRQDLERTDNQERSKRAKDWSTTEGVPEKDGEVFWSFKNKVIETSKGALLKVLKWWAPDTYAVRETRWLHIRKNERPMMCFASKCSARSRSHKFRRRRCAI